MLTHQPLVAVAVLLLLFAVPWSATADTLVVENRSSNHKKARITCFHKSSHRKPFYVNKIAPKEVAKVPIPKNLTQAFCLGLYDSKLVKLYDSKQDHERCENTCSIRLLNTGYNLWNDQTKKWEVIASSKSHAVSPKLSPFGSPAKLTSMKKSHAKSSKLSPHAASPKLSPSGSSAKLILTKKSHTKSPELSSHAASPKLSHFGSPAKSRSTKKLHAKSPELSPLKHAKSPAKSPIKHHVIPN